jgi:signal peptidase II
VRNEGAAFGIPGLFTGMFVVITIVVVALVVRALPRTERLSMALAYGLVVGGALGNVTDRLFREGAPDGKVVDFIKIGWWPTFNLADTAIVIGAGLIVWLLLRAEREERRREAASGAAAEPLPSPPGWGEKARPDGDGSGAVRAEDGRADGAEASAGAGERVGRSGPSAQGR